MRPGPIPWATNDAFAAGPDVGWDTRTRPTAIHEADGYYRDRRPAPDIMNYELHRMMLVQRNLARLQALNWELQATNTTDYQGGNLLSRCSGMTAAGALNQFLFYHDPIAGTVRELLESGQRVWSVPASSPVHAGPVGACIVDADHDDAGRRMVAINDGAVGDAGVRYATATGAGSWAAAAIALAPGLTWNAIGCDRNPAGARWLIGDDAAGGAANVYTSTDGVNFAVVATFPIGVATAIRAIGHSGHRAGALGPDDPGNPMWLVLTDADAVRSPSGDANWTAAAHGLALGVGGEFNARSLAYSRTSGRWVVALPAAAGGDVAYSDDNGATWTTIAAPFTLAAGEEPQISCDGHGTFVIGINATSQTATRFHVSTDEGLTWTTARLPSDNLLAAAGTFDGLMTDWVGDRTLNVDDEGTRPSRFSIAMYADGIPETEIFDSLSV